MQISSNQPSRARLASLKEQAARLDNTGADKNPAPGIVDAVDIQTNQRVEADAGKGTYSLSTTEEVSRSWFKNVTRTKCEHYTVTQGAVVARMSDRTETRYTLFGWTVGRSVNEDSQTVGC